MMSECSSHGRGKQVKISWLYSICFKVQQSVVLSYTFLAIQPSISVFPAYNCLEYHLRIGELYIPINYTFSEVFISQKNTINRVTLFILSNPGPHGALRLQVSFTGVNNIDWFFLSEVNICTGTPTHPTLPAIQLQSPSDGERIVLGGSSGTPTSVVLNCSVSVAGVFQWRWKQNNTFLQNGGRYQVTVADGTRTSKLNISQLNYTDAGNYTCEVRHQSQSSLQSKTQELVLPGEDGV